MRNNDPYWKDKTVATRHYRAPEVILNYDYWIEADMWSFGCIFYEMLMGYTLFNSERED